MNGNMEDFMTLKGRSMMKNLNIIGDKTNALPCEECICLAICRQRSTIKCGILYNVTKEMFDYADAGSWPLIQETLPHCVAIL